MLWEQWEKNLQNIHCQQFICYRKCIRTLFNISYELIRKLPYYNKLNFITFDAIETLVIESPVNWGCRIHWLHLCWGVRPHPNECPGYDIKLSDGEAPVMLEFGECRVLPSLPSLPGPLCPGVVAPDRVLPIYGSNRTVWHLSWV